MRKKRQRFEENYHNPLMIEPGKPLFETIQSNWEMFFHTQNPIVLELGCGTGRYTVTLAKQNPHKNFIGIDIKGARMWVGAKEAKEQYHLTNVAFLRTRIEMIAPFFSPQSIDEIYITFPDPRPKERDAKRRLTSPPFLAIYQRILKKGGCIHLKTDNDALYRYTLDTIEHSTWQFVQRTHDLYATDPDSVHTHLQTTYEKRFLAVGRTIKYVCFTLP